MINIEKKIERKRETREKVWLADLYITLTAVVRETTGNYISLQERNVKRLAVAYFLQVIFISGFVKVATQSLTDKLKEKKSDEKSLP